jgi:hypothetical protein
MQSTEIFSLNGEHLTEVVVHAIVAEAIAVPAISLVRQTKVLEEALCPTF